MANKKDEDKKDDRDPRRKRFVIQPGEVTVTQPGDEEDEDDDEDSGKKAGRPKKKGEAVDTPTPEGSGILSSTRTALDARV